MNMKRLLSLVAIFATLQASAQQVNPVPDYVFRNQMSVGRNAVTDTAAYFSIGPRYGATKGFMPPIVGDTATFSSGKRNGLLIFSVQKNKFLYWDSVRVQWSDMAGGSGSYILAGDTSAMLTPYLRKSDTTAMLSPYYRSATASAALALKLNISDTSSMLANYIRHAGYGLTKSGQSFLVDTLNIATRAWRQKGLDSLAALEVSGSGTTNYVAKFTAGSTIGNSQIFDNGSTIGIGSTAGTYYVEAKRNGTADIVANSSADNNSAVLSVFNSGGTSGNFAQLRAYGNTTASTLFGSSTNKMISLFSNGDALMTLGTISATPLVLGTTNTERLRITSGGNVGINTTSPTHLLTLSQPSGGTVIALNNTFNTANNRNWGLQSNYLAYGDFTINQSNALFGDPSAAGTSRIYIQPNGRIGINTTTDAGYQLDVNGTFRSQGSSIIGTLQGTNPALSIKNSTKEYLFQVVDADNRWRVFDQTANTERISLTSSGNVGIGTASPQRRLSVNVPFASTGDIGYLVSGQTGSTPLVEITSIVENVTTAATAMGFVTYTANAGSATEKMRLTNNGELLINTTTDAGDYKLQVAGNIYNTGSAVLAATSGEVSIGSTSTTTAAGYKWLRINGSTGGVIELTSGDARVIQMQADGTTAGGRLATITSSPLIFGTAATNRMRVTADGEIYINTETDAGDYKLQVVGNARIGTGKLDIASNTTFGLGVARSGTSEVAGQIYNSNGILYTGVESSAGGQIFTGSSAYAGVIGTGAAYPLQFAVNNATYATLNTNGRLLINTKFDNGAYPLQVAGSVYNTGQVTRGVISVQGTGAQVFVDSTTNLSPFTAFHTLSGSNISPLFSGNATWNTTGNVNGIDLYVTNTASGANSNFMQLSDGTNIFKVTKDAGVVTAAPTGGSIRKWKLGEAATVSPTSPNRTIRVEIDGTVYYLHAKTTND